MYTVAPAPSTSQYNYPIYLVTSVGISIGLFWLDYETTSWSQILEQGNWLAMSIYALFLLTGQIAIHQLLKERLQGGFLAITSVVGGLSIALVAALGFFFLIQAIQG
jgi:membrane-associated HD superfamily phosphohydrolase